MYLYHEIRCNKFLKSVVWTSIRRYSIQLYTRDGWEVIPNTRVDFPKYERVSCMKYMQLSGEQIGEQSKG